MYDSGSQWAELTLCLPSPMPFLLDLHDMKLVNFRTAVRYSLRRVDNSANMQQGESTCGSSGHFWECYSVTCFDLVTAFDVQYLNFS